MTPLVLARDRGPRGPRIRARTRGVGVALVLGLLAGACSGDDSGGQDTTTSAPALTVPADEGALATVSLATELVATVDAPTALAARPGTLDLYVAEQAGRVRRIAVTESADGERTARLVDQPVLDLTDRVRQRGRAAGCWASPSRATAASSTRSPPSSPTARRGSAPSTSARAPASTPTRAATCSPSIASSRTTTAASWPSAPTATSTSASATAGAAATPTATDRTRRSRSGSILRIDPTTPEGGRPYAIPADNPFADGEAPEIWIYGLRNPWRFSFDRDNRRPLDRRRRPGRVGGDRPPPGRRRRSRTRGEPGLGPHGGQPPVRRRRQPRGRGAAGPRVRPQRGRLRGGRRLRVPGRGAARPHRRLPLQPTTASRACLP